MFTRDVASGIPQTPTRYRMPGQDRVERESSERDRGGDPGRLEAEEGAVEHQHRAVECQPERERRQRSGDDGRLIGGELAPLVQKPDDRLGEHGGDGAGRQQEEADLAQAERDRVPEAGRVATRRQAREAREEHGRDRDREHALREHVDPKGRVDRARRQLGVDEARREERVHDER